MPEAVALMVGEANAAIEGAFDGGATDVTVNDSHGGMFNLTPEALDRRARLVLGKKPLSMNEAAADGNCDVALFVGYHARAGHPTGVISHTYNPRAVLVEVGGRPVTEAGDQRALPGLVRRPGRDGHAATTRSPRSWTIGCRGPRRSWSSTPSRTRRQIRSIRPWRAT